MVDPLRETTSNLGAIGGQVAPQVTALSNIPGQPGFEEFSDLQSRLRATTRTRPTEIDLSGVQTFTERDRTELENSMFEQFGGNPYRDVVTETAEEFSSPQNKNRVMDTIGKGHWTHLTLGNQPKQVQEAAATIFARAEAAQIKKIERIQKAQQQMFENQMKEFDRRRKQVQAQEEKTKKESEGLLKTQRSRKEAAQKEIFKLEQDLLKKDLVEGVFDSDPSAIKRQNAINGRIKILKERFEEPEGETVPETAGLDLSTPGGRARAATLRERGQEFEDTQTARLNPVAQAEKAQALKQAREELVDEISGLPRTQAIERIKKRAEEILTGAGIREF